MSHPVFSTIFCHKHMTAQVDQEYPMRLKGVIDKNQSKRHPHQMEGK